MKLTPKWVNMSPKELREQLEDLFIEIKKIETDYKNNKYKEVEIVDVNSNYQVAMFGLLIYIKLLNNHNVKLEDVIERK